MLSRLKQKLTRWARVGWGWFPLSGLGLFCLLTAIPAFRYLVLSRQDLVLLALLSGYLVVHTLLLGLTLVRTAALLWHLHRTPGPTPHGCEAERPCWLPVPVPLWRWFPLVQVDWRWLDPEAEVQLGLKDGRETEQVTLARRGNYQRIRREYLVTDLLGLTKVRLERVQLGEFQVVPGVGRLKEQPLLVRWSSGDELSDPRGEPSGDRVDMRQYTKGDSPRTILWKVYARTRRLMVRVPERALAARPKVCAYMVTGPRDEAAAAVCRVMLEGEMLGPEWRFGCDGAPGQDHQRQPALDRICRSAQSRQPQPEQMQEYLQKAQQDGYGQSIVVIPLDLGPGAQAVRDLVWRSPIPIQLCIAMDGGTNTPVRGRWRSWVIRQDAQDRTRDLLQQAAQLWQGFPGQITLIDRQSGTALGDLQALARRSA